MIDLLSIQIDKYETHNRYLERFPMWKSKEKDNFFLQLPQGSIAKMAILLRNDGSRIERITVTSQILDQSGIPMVDSSTAQECPVFMPWTENWIFYLFELWNKSSGWANQSIQMIFINWLLLIVVSNIIFRFITPSPVELFLTMISQIETPSSRFQNTRKRQNERGLLCWRLLRLRQLCLDMVEFSWGLWVSAS